MENVLPPSPCCQDQQKSIIGFIIPHEVIIVILGSVLWPPLLACSLLHHFHSTNRDPTNWIQLRNIPL